MRAYEFWKSPSHADCWPRADVLLLWHCQAAVVARIQWRQVTAAGPDALHMLASQAPLVAFSVWSAQHGKDYSVRPDS